MEYAPGGPPLAPPPAPAAGLTPEGAQFSYWQAVPCPLAPANVLVGFNFMQITSPGYKGPFAVQGICAQIDLTSDMPWEPPPGYTSPNAQSGSYTCNFPSKITEAGWSGVDLHNANGLGGC